VESVYHSTVKYGSALFTHTMALLFTVLYDTVLYCKSTVSVSPGYITCISGAVQYPSIVCVSSVTLY